MDEVVACIDVFLSVVAELEGGEKNPRASKNMPIIPAGITILLMIQ